MEKGCCPEPEEGEHNGYVRAWWAELLEYISPSFTHSCPEDCPNGGPMPRDDQLITHSSRLLLPGRLGNHVKLTKHSWVLFTHESWDTGVLATQLFILIMTLIAETLENIEKN